MLFTIIVFLLVLSVLIFAHELGHFLTARRFGVRAEEFGFGFPPRLFGVYKDKQGKWRRVRGNREVTDAADTVYSINSIPLGGFVKIKGENGDGRAEKDSFGAHPIWQRLIIISAGVLMNIVLAWVLITASYFGGVPTESDHGDILISQILPNSPAAKADIRAYDKIISISGQNFSDITNIQNFIGYSAGHELDLKLQRGQDIIDKRVTPEAKTGSKAMIGIGLIQVEIIHYPWYQAIWQGARSTVNSLWIILTSFLDLLRQAVMGQASGDAIGGPVQIAQMTGTVARVGFLYLLQFTALLSLNLAVINFFPFPALDGGRFLFLIIEKIKGKPMKRELETAMNNIGFIILLALIAWVTIKDIIKLF